MSRRRRYRRNPSNTDYVVGVGVIGIAAYLAYKLVQGVGDIVPAAGAAISDAVSNAPENLYEAAFPADPTPADYLSNPFGSAASTLSQLAAQAWDDITGGSSSASASGGS